MITVRGRCLRAPTLRVREGTHLPRSLGGFYLPQGVAQLVARTAGGREVAGSSPVTLTKIDFSSYLCYNLYRNI